MSQANGQPDAAGDERPTVSPEQLAYAKVLEVGVMACLALLAVTFVLYVAGVTTPDVPPEAMPGHWGKPSSEFVEKVGAPTGWSWVASLPASDYLNYIPICLLATLSAFAYLRVAPILLARRRYFLVTILLAELLAIALAASGILQGGH